MEAQDVKQFHNDLKAALIARAPIEIERRSGLLSGRLSESELDQLETKVLSASSGQSSEDSPQVVGTLNQQLASELNLPTRYRAALQTFEQTRSMLPVLNGLSTRLIANRQVARVMRRAFIYLAILLAVAWWGLALFRSNIIPVIDNLRADIAFAAERVPPERFDAMPWLTIIVTAVGVGCLVLIVWMLLGGTSQIAMWLGGRHYIHCRTSVSAMQTLRILLAEGMPVEDAFETSCDLTGVDLQARQNIKAIVKDPQPEPRLNTFAEYLTISANQRFAYLRVATPTTIICVVGGAVTLIYCLVLFWPVLTVLRDLTMVGI